MSKQVNKAALKQALEAWATDLERGAQVWIPGSTLRAAAHAIGQTTQDEATLAKQPAQCTDDTKRLDALAENSWNLRCFDMPTGADDADIGWRVIEHHMAKPRERTVAEVFRDDPRQAIDAEHGIKRNT